MTAPVVTEQAGKLLRLSSQEVFAKVMEPQDLKRLFVDCGISVQGGDFDDEFRFADLKGDGVLTLDEFGIYYHGVLKRQAGAAGALHNIFLAYTAFGSKPDVFMDSRALTHVCKDAKLMGDSLRIGDIDVIFSKVKTKGERKISFEQFVYALGLVAESRGEPLDTVVATVIKSGPPKKHGATESQYVRLHDDRSAYTGVYKRGGPTNFDGGANASLSFVANRKEADVRGVPRQASAYTSYDPKPLARQSRSESVHSYHESTESSTTRWRHAGSVGDLVAAIDAMPTPSMAGMSRATSARPADSAAKGEIRIELEVTGDMEEDLMNVFEAYNIFDGGDPDSMSGRAFVKLFRDRGMVKKSRGLTTQYLDLLFAKLKSKGRKRLTFKEFKTALETVGREQLEMDMPETAALIIQGGGPTAHGTIPDDMRQYDEFDSMSPEAPSTTGAMEAAEEKPRARRGDAVPQTSDPAEVVVRAAVPVEQSKWGEAQRALHVLFQDYNTFGGRADALNMDNRSFVKLCKEKGLLMPPLKPTDADIVFHAVRNPPKKTISFSEFCVALAKLVERSEGSLPSFERVMVALGKMGGAERSGTVAAPNKLHDDKSQWTGVALRGGPSNVGSGSAY